VGWVQRTLGGVALAGLVVGCGGSTRDDDAASVGMVPADDGPSAGDSTGGSSTGPAPVTPEPDKLDVGNGMPTGSAGDLESMPCKKVDLLFVIDSSGSMDDEQANLVASFPNFIDTMRDELAETDGYNVAVIRTDNNDISCEPNRYGVFVTRNYTVGSSQATCTPYASDLRYMTQEDDLDVTFECAARVGIGGDGDERPMQALMSALSSPNTDVGDCNEGFLRDDALLIVVVITDEEDDHETEAEACNGKGQPGSDGEPADWFDAIVAAKGGVEGNVVVLSLVGPTGADACPPLDKCDGGLVGAEPTPRLIEFTEMFTYGYVGAVCGDYEPFFDEAVGAIKSACDDFTTPG